MQQEDVPIEHNHLDGGQDNQELNEELQDQNAHDPDENNDARK